MMVSGSKFTLLGIAIILFALTMSQYDCGAVWRIICFILPFIGLLFSILGCFFMYEEYDDD